MKVLFTSFRRLPIEQPAADSIRFLKLSQYISEKNNVSYLSSGSALQFKVVAFRDRPYYRLPGFPSAYISVIALTFMAPFYLKRIIKIDKPDVIFVNSFFYAFITKVAKKNNVRIHLDIMGLEYSERKIGKRSIINSILSPCIQAMERRIIKNADFITCVNEAHATIIRAITNKPIYVLRDGVDKVMASYNNSPMRARKQTSSIQILFVGSLVHRRLDDLFFALESILALHPTVSLVIAGDGSDRQYYQELSNQKGFGERVQFLGYVPHEEVMELMLDSDICYSDDWSGIGFPTKVFEYMAAGKAIVVSGTEAVKEVIIDGHNGVVYGSPAELADKISALITDEKERSRLGNAARTDLLGTHTWEHRRVEIEQIYKHELAITR